MLALNLFSLFFCRLTEMFQRVTRILVQGLQGLGVSTDIGDARLKVGDLLLELSAPCRLLLVGYTADLQFLLGVTQCELSTLELLAKRRCFRSRRLQFGSYGPQRCLVPRSLFLDVLISLFVQPFR